MGRRRTTGSVVVLCAAAVLSFAAAARAQRAPPGPSEDVEEVVAEAGRATEAPLAPADRPLYDALQRSKRDLSARYGIHWAVENTTIYQAASGGVDPNDALVNTLGLFATWKVFRDENGKDFAGPAFQAETRGDPFDGHFTDLRDSLGALWSPNDATSDDYAKINQFWWGQRLAGGRLGFVAGKIDPGGYINGIRFAGSGNTQFFSQPFATNPARSFPDNGLGFMARAEPAEWLYLHFTVSDSDAVSTYSPFKTLDGNWFYAGEAGLRPSVPGFGAGVYRLMLYQRDLDSADEFGWSVSADQDLSDACGVFVRY